MPSKSSKTSRPAPTPAKPKVALYWAASCGGCEESVVDLAEGVLDVLGLVDIVFWPVAMDFKRKDVEAYADGEIAVCLWNGGIRNTEQEEMAHLLRRKSGLMIAYGACAHMGGIPALANQFPKEEILQWVYHDAPTVTNDEGTRPQESHQVDGLALELPGFHNKVRSLDQVVAVDYVLPGCPPTPELLMAALQAILAGDLPPTGTVLSPDKALCEECARKDTKPAELSIAEFKRPHTSELDPEECLLAQGFVCLGPATRSGCGALCVEGNMPCTGCFGPTSRVVDQGAKALSSMASVAAGVTPEEADKVLAGIPDPVGTFYRYGLAKSLLRGKVSIHEVTK